MDGWLNEAWLWWRKVINDINKSDKDLIVFNCIPERVESEALWFSVSNCLQADVFDLHDKKYTSSRRVGQLHINNWRRLGLLVPHTDNAF